MPSMAEIPNRATKPIAAKTLNGVSVNYKVQMPPSSAIGMTLVANRMSDRPRRPEYILTEIDAGYRPRTAD
jgi:hypothetical protein